MRHAALRFQPVPNAAVAPRSSSRAAGRPARSNLSTSLTLAAMSLGYGVVQLDVTIVNTALDRIGSALGGGVSELQWVVNAYTIAFAAFILTSGALGDRIGAKRVFMAGFAIFTTASLACALAPTLWTLVAALRDAPVGMPHPVIYGARGRGFNDIVQGNTGGPYAARVGWDAASGWGSPNGRALARELARRERGMVRVEHGSRISRDRALA